MNLKCKLSSPGRLTGALGGGGGLPYIIGGGLKVDGYVLSVDTADTVERDDTKPVTSAAVEAAIPKAMTADELRKILMNGGNENGR